jgi:hypothetical protein
MFRPPTKYSEYLQDVRKSIDYILKRVNAKYVSKIVAGTNVTISPADGTGVVTINADLGGTGDYGSFYSNIDQPIVAPNTPQVVTIGSTYEANGVSTVGGKIYFSNAGKYQFSYVAQVSSLSNAQETSVFWIRYNGVDYPHSATTITLQPRKTSVLPSEQLMTAIFTGTALNDNDYIELWWQSTSATSKLQYVPASGTYPETPSVIANVIPVGGGGGGSEYLSDLMDVNISLPTEGQFLAYNATTGLWENVTADIAPGSGELDIDGGTFLVPGGGFNFDGGSFT